MIKKRGKKSLVNKGGKGDKIEKIKKEDKVEKTKKEDKVEKSDIDKQLEKITTDAIIDAMVEHKWLVAKTIAMHIIGIYTWEKLSEEDQYIIIKRINEIKLKTPGLM